MARRIPACTSCPAGFSACGGPLQRQNSSPPQCDPRGAFLYHRMHFSVIQKGFRPVIRTKAWLRSTTYYCIPTYALPVTAGLPARPTQTHLWLYHPRLSLSACNSGVIFGVRLPVPGFHHPRIAVTTLRPYSLRHRLFLSNVVFLTAFFFIRAIILIPQEIVKS